LCERGCYSRRVFTRTLLATRTRYTLFDFKSLDKTLARMDVAENNINNNKRNEIQKSRKETAPYGRGSALIFFDSGYFRAYFLLIQTLPMSCWQQGISFVASACVRTAGRTRHTQTAPTLAHRTCGMIRGGGRERERGGERDCQCGETPPACTQYYGVLSGTKNPCSPLQTIRDVFNGNMQGGGRSEQAMHRK
jgi:hypothetical protein